MSNRQEIYWIEVYHGYSLGYNATIGGDGKPLFNYDEIATSLRNGLPSKEIAKIFGCCLETVRKVAVLYNIPLNIEDNALAKQMKSNTIAVKQFDLDGNYIQSFKSYADAARWLEDNNYVVGNLSGVRTKIGEVCSGKRKTAYKFIWRKE